MIVAAVCCCCLISCNEKPKNYKFVKVAVDGKEEVEEITAVNDTDAVKQFFGRMEKILVENIEKGKAPYKSMFVISPEGDTLNKDEALMEAAMANSLEQQDHPLNARPLTEKQ